MDRIDIMVDIETLGVGENPTIIQLSAIAFDITTGEYIDTFDQCVDITNKNQDIDANTLLWWLDTDKELLNDIIKRGKYGNTDIKYTHLKFNRWINCTMQDADLWERDVFLWGNGILFDNRIIQQSMASNGITYPIFYRNDRDMRTIIELAAKKKGMTSKDYLAQFDDDSLKKHDALDDVKFQIKAVTSAWAELIS